MMTGLAAGPAFLVPNDWMFDVIGDHEKRAFIGSKTQAVIDTIIDHYKSDSTSTDGTRPLCADVDAKAMRKFA